MTKICRCSIPIPGKRRDTDEDVNEMAMQNEPILVYAKTDTVSSSPRYLEAEDFSTEIVVNEDGFT